MADAQLAVLGSPIAHSQSPALHAAAYRTLGWDWEYGRFEVAEADLASFLDAHSGWAGFSLTMPLKTELVRLAELHGWSVDDTARLTGGGNTWAGGPVPGVFNTDVYGIEQALREVSADVSTCAVVGSGATAKSAVLAAVRLGTDRVDVFARSADKAQALADFAQSLGAQSHTAAIGELHLDSWSTILSTLPSGALREDSLELPKNCQTTVFEAGYAPGGFSLAQAAAKRGGTAVSGQRMLIHQAIRQIELFGIAQGQTAGPFDAQTRTALEETMTQEAQAL